MKFYMMCIKSCYLSVLFIVLFPNINAQESSYFVPNIEHNGVLYRTVQSPYTGKIWLDRNLGADRVCVSFDDSACYGDYYQWGRNADGHEDTMENKKYGISKAKNNKIDNVGNKFIASSNPPQDWVRSADNNGHQREAVWSKTDGSSVCPIGFRVPTIFELKAELLNDNFLKIKDKLDAFNSFLKLPSAGYRNDAGHALLDQGSWGRIWSSTPNGHGAAILYFSIDYAGASKSNKLHTYSPRSFGRSVRCIKN